MKIDNINNDYAIISNSANAHALLSLKALLPVVTIDANIEKFTGVSRAALTNEYIDTKASGGSTTPLVWNNFLKIKFDSKQAGDAVYQAGCLNNSQCVIDRVTVASIVGNICGGDGLFDNDYLMFYKNTDSSYALKLHSGFDDSVLNTVSNSGKIVNANNELLTICR